MTTLTLAQLTEKKLDGGGVFDVLLQTLKLHLDTQYSQNRITGPEYAQVYIGQVEQALQTGLSFLVQSQRVGLEAELLAQQVELAKAQLLIAQAQLLQTQAQTALIEKQADNLLSEKALTEANAAKVIAETLNVPKQGLLLDEGLVKAKQESINSEVEKRVLEGQVCKLQAEYDYTQQNTLKAASELNLMNQKIATEKAQIMSLGVDEDSVLGRQKALYKAQTEGFARDAEQKAAKIMIDSWNVRRTTDEGTVADDVNKLKDSYIGQAVAQLLAGMGAT